MNHEDSATLQDSPPGQSASESPLPVRKGARWGEPIKAADHVWTRFELGLALLAFVLEASSMTLWVCLKGFSAPAEHVSSVVFRAIVGATVLGVGARIAFSRQPEKVRDRATLTGVLVGIFTAKAWVHFGAEYSSNLLNWYQQASFLTLLGGLRGVGTRLTMLLALLGGSLATARGRHIVIDVVTRFVGVKARTVMVLTGWVASSAVCIVTAWGFFDHIAIESFGANADATAGTKVREVGLRLAEDFFVARKQLELDLRATPHVLFRGETYSDWLTGKEWNAWIDSAGFAERY